MKKILIFLFLIIVFIILFNTYPTKEKVKEVSLVNKYTFYKEELKKRYDDYKIKNPNLSELDVIIRVNLNLDKPFYTNVTPSKNLNSNIILVNKYYYLNENYIPNNLVEITKNVNGKRLLVKEAADMFYKMSEEIEKNNMSIRIISAYRSYEYQKTLYNNYVLKDGQEKADTYSARPGFSEHQTGLVIDIDNNKLNYENFENTEEYKWMQNNSYKYGFILRYPKDKEDITGYQYESWHYRYVGIDVAKVLHDENMTLDEYIAKLN